MLVFYGKMSETDNRDHLLPVSNHSPAIGGRTVMAQLSLSERFWQHVEQRGPDECWSWTGSTIRQGRGWLWNGRKKVTAPRIAWEIHHGRPLADDLCACHSCDNPNCVNPAHIWAGTNRDNQLDSRQKGRAYPNSPVCQNGHSFTPENTYTYPETSKLRGRRYCRICKTNRNRRASGTKSGVRGMPTN